MTRAALMVGLSCFTAVSNAESTRPVKLDRLAIPQKDQLYRHFVSRLVRSEREWNSFVGEMVARCGATPTWSRQPSDQGHRPSLPTIAALQRLWRHAAIDADREFVALLFHTEGSGSVQVELAPAPVVDGTMTLELERTNPQLRTMDMAYWALAVRVPRDVAERVRLPVFQGRHRTYDLRSGDEIIPPDVRSEPTD